MREITGDLFAVQADAICITTNGYIKANGENVMGKGCAFQLSKLYPQAPRILGQELRKHGNCVNYLLKHNGAHVFSFPVKPVSIVMEHEGEVVRHMRNKFKPGDTVPGWACVADIDTIFRSAHQLLEIVNQGEFQNVVIPRPGCGAGELNWSDVKPVLDSILDDRFAAITFD